MNYYLTLLNKLLPAKDILNGFYLTLKESFASMDILSKSITVIFVFIILIQAMIILISIWQKKGNLKKEIIGLKLAKAQFPKGFPKDVFLKKYKTISGITGDCLEILVSYYNTGVETSLSVLQENIISNLSVGDEQIRFKINSLTMIGLLGTFTGLIITVVNATGALNGNVENLSAYISGFLSGMWIKFSTSILGLLFSIVLGTYFITLKNRREQFYKDIIYTMSNTFLPELNPTLESEVNKQIKSISMQFYDLFERFSIELNAHLLRLDSTHTKLTEEYHKKYEDSLKDSLDKLNAVSEQHFKTYRNTLTKLINQLPESFTGLWTSLDSLIKGMENLIVKTESNTAALTNIAGDYKSIISEMKQIKESYINIINETTAAFKTTLDKSIEKTTESNKSYIENMNRQFDQIISKVDDKLKSVVDAAKAQSQISDSQMKTSSILLNTITDQLLSMTDMNESFTKSGGILEKLELISQNIDKSMLYLKNTSDYLKELDRKFNNSVESLNTTELAVNQQNAEIIEIIKTITLNQLETLNLIKGQSNPLEAHTKEFITGLEHFKEAVAGIKEITFIKHSIESINISLSQNEFNVASQIPLLKEKIDSCDQHLSNIFALFRAQKQELDMNKKPGIMSYFSKK